MVKQKFRDPEQWKKAMRGKKKKTAKVVKMERENESEDYKRGWDDAERYAKETACFSAERCVAPLRCYCNKCHEQRIRACLEEWEEGREQ
jgi:hypothetical protein